ncbi:M16 family metallopeptidase [Sunxiuqinia sp. A32]|uniref:M16 family metallopeptidase n=1 Tax=Sunxiuqinia sp. A32 TaxID=3461496 RepID=UPI00404674EF
MIIDRKIAPQIFTADKPDLTFPRVYHLDNKLPVYLLNAGTKEVTKIEFIFETGTWFENHPLQAALTNSMLQEGSNNYSSSRIAGQFDFHGAYLQLVADQHFGVVSLVSLNKHLPNLFPVLEDLIKHSIFPEEEFQTLVKRRKQRFLLENEKVKVLCQKKFSQVLFGDTHPYAQTVVAGDFDSVKNEDLLSFYTKGYRSNNCEIVVSGMVTEEIIHSLNQYFGGDDWNGNVLETKTFQIASALSKFHQVEKKDAIQSALRIGKLMERKDHPDFPALQLLVTVLGGYFTSRLMMNIREEKGYTYGIGSSMLAFKNAGYLIIATETDKKYEQATIDEVFKELAILRNELIGQVELERVKQYLLGEFIRDFDGPFALSVAFRGVLDYDMDYQFYENYYQTLLNVTPQKLNELALKYFKEDDFYSVTVGAKS